MNISDCDLSRSNVDAKVVLVLVKALMACGVRTQLDVGVISPFRSHVADIEDALSKALTSSNSSSSSSSSTSSARTVCEVSTIDKYQGRDKEVVILSLGIRKFAKSVDNENQVLRLTAICCS